MPFDPSIHHRKSIRMKGYNYSRAGGYYVTIVAQGRECLFGEIVNGEMVLNDAGRMVLRWWNELPHKFPLVTLGDFVIMPNHFHGIIFIHEIVGADLGVCPGEHVGLSKPMQIDSDSHTPGEHVGSPQPGSSQPGSPQQRSGAPLSQVMQWFKTMTTNEYIRGVKQSGWPPFPGKLWQRNYYEHIIRSQADYERIAAYIALNPAKWGEDGDNPFRKPDTTGNE